MRFPAIAAVLLAAAWTATAHAHSGLVSTTPADGATVDAELSEITLEFSQPVRVTLIRLNASEAPQAVEPETDLPASFVDTVEVDLPTLQPGSYETQWTAVAQDGHVLDGTFSFTITD